MDGTVVQAQPVRQTRPAEKASPARLGWGAKLGVVILWALLFGLAWGGAMFGFGLVEFELLKSIGRPSPLFAFFPMSGRDDLLTMALLHAVPGFGVGAIAAVASGSSTKWSAHVFRAGNMIALVTYYALALAGMSLVVSHGIDEAIRRGASIGSALDFYGILHTSVWSLVSFAGGLRFGLRAKRLNPELGIGGVTTIAFGWAGAAFLGFLNLPYITLIF
ncbi:hypothetical protein [Marimonas arenosa]|uniref:Uncharacterized protein n=1 Tax=Marimonas arenosa TaxID=1795305 RepID=A0AAE3WEY2_9RHOB|nr:hypothetical protein [Marimonas arenosa]MDQ2091125.1 hypothetical protein [Marimonas arenosa]